MDALQRVESLADHLLEFAGVRRPPVPLELMQAVADARLFYANWRYHQGYILQVGSTFYIAVNGNDSAGEQRFSAFHELYHVIERIQPSFRQLAADSQSHALADHFALALLLNDRWFPACARASGGDIEELATDCGVTTSAVMDKLAAIGRQSYYEPVSGRWTTAWD